MDNWSNAIIRALDIAKASVVHVSATDQESGSVAFGSGLVIDHRTVITSAQIAEAGHQISVTDAEGRKYGAECIGSDPLYFLSILHLDERFGLELAPFGKVAQLSVGQPVIAVGSPFGMEHTVTSGVISSVDRTIYRPERYPVDGLIVVDAAIHPGNMSGALANLDGEIIGLNGIPWMHGLSLAVQIDIARLIANQLIEYGIASHPWLGFSGQLEVVKQSLVELFQLPVDRGVVVSHVAKDGPGERAGIQAFDMCVRVDGAPVSSVGSIRQVLSRHRPGDLVPVTLLRGGELLDVELVVENMPGLDRLPTTLQDGAEDDDDEEENAD